MAIVNALKGNSAGAHLLRFATSQLKVYELVSYITRKRHRRSVRSINYHHVPEESADEFRRQLAWIVERFDPLSLEDLRNFQRSGHQTSKPGIVITFDDGLLSHVSNVVPILDEFGVPGWFFVPTDAASTTATDQFAWAADHGIRPQSLGDEGDQLFAGWNDWRAIDKRHVVASHTATHRRFNADVSGFEIQDELKRSYAALDKELLQSDRIFCWVGGEEASYSRTAAREIRRSGTEFAFTTCSKPFGPNDDPLRIERTNVEASFSWDRFMLAMSGLMDWRFATRRRRLDAVLVAQ